MPTQSALSTEWRRYTVAATTTDGTTYDPTVTAVPDFAFRAPGHPPTQAGDWWAGSWETHPGPPIRYVARVLVGPAGINPGRGEWVVWIRLTDGPEVVTRAVDTLQLI